MEEPGSNRRPPACKSSAAFAASRNTAGKRVGRGSAICVQINAAGTEYQCLNQNHFPGGDIFTAGFFSATAKTYVEAIVGGTGVYAGLTGTVAGTWLAADFSRAREVFTLHFLSPSKEGGPTRAPPAP